MASLSYLISNRKGLKQLSYLDFLQFRHAKIDGKNCINDRPLLVRHLLSNRLLEGQRISGKSNVLVSGLNYLV